jgi:type IV secretion system protein TrbJ
MKRRFASRKRRGFIFAALLVIIFFMPLRPAFAIFGMGDVVFDPSAYATLGHIWNEDISTGAKIIQEYNELIKIYSTGMSLYNFSRAMAVGFHSGQRAAWMMAVEPAVNDYTESRYGETAMWPQVMNGAPAYAPQAWTAATVPMNVYPYFNAQVAIGSTMADLATVEAMDGSAKKCLQIIARHQLNTPLNQLAFLGLRFSQNNDTDSTNSQIEQLNMLNASNSQAVNEARTQSMIHSCEVEQQMIANKIQRDQLANRLNFMAQVDQYSVSEGPDWGNAASAISTYRSQ